MANDQTDSDPSHGDRIKLVGGPGDGRIYWWNGGDEMRFAVSAPAELKSITWLPVPIPVEDIIYRRSLGNRLLFIFQP